MIDLKTLGSALDQLEAERNIPREKIIEALETALAAAYKKDYGKKGQIVRANFDMDSGKTEFFQIKKVLDETMIKPETEDGEEDISDEKETEKTPIAEDGGKESPEGEPEKEDGNEEEGEGETMLVRFNPEQHILLEDAKKIKKDVQAGDEIVFPLETKDDYGRIAAQTAKQIIIQKIREAEKISVLKEFGSKQGEIVSGEVRRVERGNVFVDLDKASGILPYEEQIPGERFRQGERIRAYLYSVEETPRGISLKLSRSHPKFIESLFKIEAPEVASGVVEIKAIAREAGSRSKIAVHSNDEHIDPVGSCVGQRGVRVSTVMSELGGEKIDIIEWSDDPKKFIEDALSPAKISHIEIDEEEKRAEIEVDADQLSLAIGKGGQNVRLAAKLTGWKIDITGGEEFVKQGIVNEEDLAGEDENGENESSGPSESLEEEIHPDESGAREEDKPEETQESEHPNTDANEESEAADEGGEEEDASEKPRTEEEEEKEKEEKEAEK